ncbi:MAG: hypothetical protein ACD_79C01092G0002 [uncultured bacterium]|nr:MAG: hypothetical protein ACD_79C01092G0002 [uncultured bacterium]
MSVKERRFYMFLVDIVLINISLYLSFYIRWDGRIPGYVLKECYGFFLGTTITRIVCFYFFDLYNWSFRHASVSEAVRVLKAVFWGTVIIIAGIFFFNLRTYVGRTVPLIDFMLCSFFILGFRFFLRVSSQLFIRSKDFSSLKKVLIIGAGQSGTRVAKELIESAEKKYLPVGFIDDDPNKRKQSIQGIKVLGKTQQIAEIVNKYDVEEIIIAIPSASGKEIREIISRCQKINVKFKIVPGLHKILSGKVEMKRARSVKPEDLLGREAVLINDSEVASYIENKIVLISGAAGSIGSEIVRQVSGYKPRTVILYDINENDIFFLENELKKEFPQLNYKLIIGDIKDISLLKHTFSTFQPQVVFHAAAHKHVPLMEANPCAAIKNNVLGTRNLIYAAEHYHVERFVLISTDKAVNPTSIMGATKRITEMLCQAKASIGKTKFMAVRFGNVIGSNGSVVQLFNKQIEAGLPLTVTHPDIRRYFMTVSEAAQLVLQAGSMGKGGEIFILDMGEQIKIVDLAKNLITLSGLEFEKDISIEFTGLRPGEKLYEEVLHDSEHDKATLHNKIFIAPSEEFDINKLNTDIDTLRRYSKLMDNEKVISKIKEVVPNFTFTAN